MDRAPHRPTAHPQTAPNSTFVPRIGAYVFVMTASGALVSSPTMMPAQIGDNNGNRMVAAKNPRADREQNAPSSAAVRSGRCSGKIFGELALGNDELVLFQRVGDGGA